MLLISFLCFQVSVKRLHFLSLSSVLLYNSPLLALCIQVKALESKDLTLTWIWRGPVVHALAQGAERNKGAQPNGLSVDLLIALLNQWLDSVQKENLVTLIGTPHTEDPTFLSAFISIHKMLVPTAPNSPVKLLIDERSMDMAWIVGS